MRNKELRKPEIALIFRTLAFGLLKGKSNADDYSNGKATVAPLANLSHPQKGMG